ncbi:hypothetical protein SCALIN_C17_0056 [Candidatus Scalindua japonica]|uniref:Cytochrome c n=1 Tax=Candidatus Scalindua japonica TaxID=1284222 RepID=A0A286TYP3_9BACT|nr:hypothetical protein [Candidatus Scalindua japonica]GAX61023.1 hypothetical protein SCALIN_C17_0056 [Candidatus Scalindua japonica]
MEIHSNKFTRNILKFSIIGLIFVLSCGKVEEQIVGNDSDENAQWYTKLGFKEHMKQIKSDTTLLTRKMGEGDWADAEALCANIEKSFGALDLSSDEIPEDFFELQEMFKDQLARITKTCKEKDFDGTVPRLRALKQSCSHCHRVLRKEFDRMNVATDYDVAVDKIYKDKNTGGN